MKPEREHQQSYGSPYAAGFGLGLILLFSYWVLGTGLGASGALARCSAWLEHAFLPRHTAASPYFGVWFGEGAPHVLQYYLVFMGIGILLGGLLSARAAGRIEPGVVERGPRIGARGRLWFALAGGILAGFASRMARGCTSGQALSGSALLLTGSVLFMVCIFVGGYATAFFVRREWR